MSRKESFTAIANSQKSLPFVAKLYILDICGGPGYVPDRLSKIIFLIHRKLTFVLDFRADQWTGFYIITASVMKELRGRSIVVSR